MKSKKLVATWNVIQYNQNYEIKCGMYAGS